MILGPPPPYYSGESPLTTKHKHLFCCEQKRERRRRKKGMEVAMLDIEEGSSGMMISLRLYEERRATLRAYTSLYYL